MLRADQPDEREAIIQAIFNLPSDTVFYDDFSCAISSGVSLHGRMYLTDHCVCFYSNLFGRERRIVVPYSQITSVSKTTLLFIRQGISIETNDECYVFTSFWGNSLDSCIDILQSQLDKKSTSSSSPPHNNPDNSSTTQSSTQDENTSSKSTSMEHLISASFPIKRSEFINRFLVDDAPHSYESFLSSSGTATDVICEKWTEGSAGKSRSMQFNISIDVPIGPKTSRVDVLQRWITKDDSIIIETSTRLVDIPYGDYFSVEDRWIIKQEEDDHLSTTTLRIEIEVVFSKYTFLKRKIESRAREDCREKYKNWIAAMQSVLMNNGNSKSSDAKKHVGRKNFSQNSNVVMRQQFFVIIVLLLFILLLTTATYLNSIKTLNDELYEILMENSRQISALQRSVSEQCDVAAAH